MRGGAPCRQRGAPGWSLTPHLPSLESVPDEYHDTDRRRRPSRFHARRLAARAGLYPANLATASPPTSESMASCRAPCPSFWTVKTSNPRRRSSSKSLPPVPPESADWGDDGRWTPYDAYRIEPPELDDEFDVPDAPDYSVTLEPGYREALEDDGITVLPISRSRPDPTPFAPANGTGRTIGSIRSGSTASTRSTPIAWTDQPGGHRGRSGSSRPVPAFARAMDEKNLQGQDSPPDRRVRGLAPSRRIGDERTPGTGHARPGHRLHYYCGSGVRFHIGHSRKKRREPMQ